VTLLFPDTTVLINFAIIHRMDLLTRLANGKGQWCATVRSECAESSRQPHLTDLVDAPTIFGEPLYPDVAEHVDIVTLRTQMADPYDPPHMHLGEAETIVIVGRRSLDAFFATDDRDAASRAKHHGVATVTTWYLLKFAVRLGAITADELWADVLTLRSHHRGSPPGVTDRPSFDAWLAS
jgi:predicted nucleic acid-binding protein